MDEFECYKVVSTAHGEWLVSAVVDDPVLMVRYKVGKFVSCGVKSAEGYGLLAFDSISAAIAFSDIRENSVVYRAIGRGPIDPNTHPMLATGLTRDYDVTILGKRSPIDWPDGTVMYQEIALVEKVYEYGLIE